LSGAHGDRNPELFSREEVREMRAALEGAAWADGRLTAGHRAARVKDNDQLPLDDPLAVQLANRVLERLGQTPRFIAAALPLRVLQPRFSRYDGQGQYGNHVDNAIFPMPGTGQHLRSDVSSTLFLSDPDEYEGGELTIEDMFGQQRIKLPAGHLIVSRQQPAPRGPCHARAALCGVFWTQSLVASPEKRRMLFELDGAIQNLSGDVPDHAALDLLTNVYPQPAAAMVHHVKPPLAAPPPDLRSLADYAARARSHERRGLAAHRGRLRRGRNLARQCPKPARWRLLPRALADLRGGSTALTLLGQRHAAPILLGPVAYQRLVHPDGEIATARLPPPPARRWWFPRWPAPRWRRSRRPRGRLRRNWARRPRRPVVPALSATHARGEPGAGAPRRGGGLWRHCAHHRRGHQAGGHGAARGVAAVNLAGQAPVRQQARLGGAAVFGTPLADAAPRWEDLAWLRAQNAPAAAGEGHGAGRGRAARGGYGGGWADPFQPRRARAGWSAAVPEVLPRCAPRWARCRCWWMAAFGVAPTL
jgi:PKHD-type hydroxylase